MQSILELCDEHLQTRGDEVMRLISTRNPILFGVIGAAIVVVALWGMTAERLTPALLIGTVVVVIAANLWDYLDWRHHTERD